MKRKIMILTIAFLSSVLMCANVFAAASGRCGDSITWTLDDSGNLTLSGSGEMWNYGIVTSPFKDYGIKTVTIGDGITSIGDYAFYSCRGLTELTLPNSVTSIGNPNSVTSIGNSAFGGCSGLEKITVDGGNKRYDSRDNCNSIIDKKTNTLIVGSKNSVIPNGVTSIGDSAFGWCSELTELVLPNSVTSIVESAFAYCSGLEKITVESGNSRYDSRDNCNSIIETATNTLIAGCKNSVIPNSVTSIGDSAFGGCSGLTELTLPNSVTSIGDCAFEGCSGMTELTLPSSITSIGWYAFQGCSGLTELTLPNSITSIGESAFSGCSGLTELTLPDSLKSIDGSVFSGCSSLTKLTLPNSLESIGEHAFSDCRGLTELTLPNSVASIGNGAFGGCSGLTELTLPNSVTSIGDAAFSECSGLSKITSLAGIPPVCGFKVFNGVNKTNCELIVPEESITAYKQAKGWNEFSNIRGFVGEKK